MILNEYRRLSTGGSKKSGKTKNIMEGILVFCVIVVTEENKSAFNQDEFTVNIYE